MALRSHSALKIGRRASSIFRESRLLFSTDAGSDRIVPLSWEELRVIFREGDVSRCLPNDEQSQTQLEGYKSLEDYVLCSVFESSRTKDLLSGKWRVMMLEQNSINSDAWSGPQKILTRNTTFPYLVASEIDQWILWKWGSTPSPEDADYAIRELKWTYAGSKNQIVDTLWWLPNPLSPRLPDLHQMHILTKRGSRAK